MELKLGEKIREQRLKHSVTQEKLAAYLDVTAQAVSRWENGAGYPDISLLPGIASFFGVSLDELMGIDLSLTEQNNIVLRLAGLFKEGRLDECIGESEEALGRFPSNYNIILLSASAAIGKFAPEGKCRRKAVRIREITHFALTRAQESYILLW